jgi:hypothetical protein
VAGGARAAPLAVAGAGVLLAYSGLTGRGWLAGGRALLHGQAPSTVPKTAPITDTSAAPITDTSAAALAGVIPGPTPSGMQQLPLGDLGGTATANRALGRLMAAAYGWTGQDWTALDYGWGTLESGWNQFAAFDHSDPYNHAYGIPQANPGTKMASAGPDWKIDPATQIRWGLGYIKSTYGSPSQVPGWLGGSYGGY